MISSGNKAIAAPYATKPLAVGQRISMSSMHEVMNCTCSFTGITMAIDIPAIRNCVLEYNNPLSIYRNCKGLIEQGEEYLRLLDTQVLSGIVLTVYKYYDLFASNTQQSAALDNALLRTSGKEPLIEALILSNSINNRNSAEMPQLSLSYTAHSTAQSFGPALQEYLKVIRGIIWVSPEERRSKEQAVGVENRADRRKKTLGLSDIEKQYEEELKENKKLAKALICEMAGIPAIPTKLVAYLKVVCSGRNLVILDNELRVKLVAKLTAYNILQATRMAKLIKDSENPYDIFASTTASLDRASDTVESVLASQSRKMSLKEILEKKKQEEARKKQTVEEQVAEHFEEEREADNRMSLHSNLGSSDISEKDDNIHMDIIDEMVNDDEGGDF